MANEKKKHNDRWEKDVANGLQALRLRCSHGEFFAENLFEFVCKDSNELLKYFKTGVKSRTV